MRSSCAVAHPRLVTGVREDLSSAYSVSQQDRSFFSATTALTSDEPSRTALERACFKVPTRSSFRNAVRKIADAK